MRTNSKASILAAATLTVLGAASLTACGKDRDEARASTDSSEKAAASRALDDASSRASVRNETASNVPVSTLASSDASALAVVTADETSAAPVIEVAAPAESTESSRPGLGTLAATTDGLGTLAKLATLCGLVDALNDPKANLTVFAPTDAAFAAFLGGAPAPESCTPEVKTILTYHVLPARVLSTDLKATQSVVTLAGTIERVFVTKGEGGVVVNGGSKVVAADVLASNGVAHVVDKVLLPDAFGTVVDAAAKRYSLTSLVGAVASAGLVDALATAKSITVFAPTNTAFAKLPAVPTGTALNKVLTHHVAPQAFLARTLLKGHVRVQTLEGSAVTVALDAHGRASIRGSGETLAQAGRFLKTDIVTKNGVVHLIDDVLIPAGL